LRVRLRVESPRTVRDRVGRPVVQPRQVLEAVQRKLGWLDPQLVLQLADRRALRPWHRPRRHIVGPIDFSRLEPDQLVRATRVGPHAREGDLGGRALLEEQPSLGHGEIRREEEGGGRRRSCTAAAVLQRALSPARRIKIRRTRGGTRRAVSRAQTCGCRTCWLFP